ELPGSVQRGVRTAHGRHRGRGDPGPDLLRHRPAVRDPERGIGRGQGLIVGRPGTVPDGGGSWRSRSAAVVAAACLVVGACSPGATNAPAGSAGSGPASGGPVVSAAPSTAGSATASGSPAAASLPPGTFVNPVIADDFPDPFILETDDGYFAYATTDGAQNLQLA